jgi:serine/threonine protein phosphatase PrpC
MAQPWVTILQSNSTKGPPRGAPPTSPANPPPTKTTTAPPVTTSTTVPVLLPYQIQVSSKSETVLTGLDHFVVCVATGSGDLAKVADMRGTDLQGKPVVLRCTVSGTPVKVRVIAYAGQKILAVGDWQSAGFPWMLLALSTFILVALLVVLMIFLLRRPSRQFIPLATDASLLFTPTPPPPPARRVEEVAVLLPDRLGELTEQRRKHLKNVLTLGLSVGAPVNAPVATKTGLTWVVEAQSEVVGLALWSEKVPGKGEDALPSLMIHKSGKRGFLSVYDGLGGAGAAPASLLNGSPISNAFESSRITREVTENWAAPVVDALKVRPGALASLNTSLQEELERRGTEIAETGRGFSSSLKRTLPTTVAAISFDRSKDSGKIRAIWAGDSRAYLLTPTGGLQQLTIDDTRAADALEALVDDPPIENLVCADREVELNTHTVGTSGPFIAVVATDGCFGYWPSPPIFEFEVLKALVEASTYSGWAAALQKTINEVARDDTSLSLVSVGYQSFSHLRSQFLARYSFLAETIFTPFAELHAASSDRAAFEEYRTTSWASYKATYERIGPRRRDPE